MININLIAQWLHILFYASWFGGLVFFTVVLAGTLQRFPLGSQHSRQFIGMAARRFGAFSIGALVLAAITGTIRVLVGDYEPGYFYNIYWLIVIILIVLNFIAAIFMFGQGRALCNLKDKQLSMDELGHFINKLYKRIRLVVRFSIASGAIIPLLIFINIALKSL